MKKRLSRALITSLVMSSLFLTTVFASPQDDIESLESQKSAAEAEASSVNDSLVDLLKNYQALEDDIDNQTVKIEKATDDLAAAQEKEKSQYEDMKLRIKYMYEEGDTSFISALLSAESFSDLLAKSEYVDKVYNYDRDKLKEYVETKEKVQDLKDELEGQEAEMEDMAIEMESQTANLQSTLDSLESQISDFDDQLAEAKAAAEAELAAQKAAEEAAAQAEAEAQAQAEAEEAAQAEAEEAAQAEADATTEEEAKAVDEAAKAAEEAEKSSNTNAEKSSSTSSKSSNKSSSSSSKSGSSSSKSNSSSSSSNKTSTSSSSSSSSSTPSNASLGQQIADKACEYVGGKYVYGGNSLTSGVDCSGFVQQIHKLFGISTPRSSGDIRYGGKGVSWEDKLPGDVICYSGHVAIYIGNNQICHASNSAPYPKGGIKISSPANYRTVLAVRRYW